MYPEKRLGYCTRCGRDVPGVEATQIEFLLSDGSTCAVTFCISCAEILTAEDWPQVWRTCVDATHHLLLIEATKQSSRLSRLTIVGVQGRRREDPATPGAVIVDTR